jgi:hypothetical protein
VVDAQAAALHAGGVGGVVGLAFGLEAAFAATGLEGVGGR